MRTSFLVALAITGIILAILYHLSGCSAESGNSAVPDCHDASDSTVVCGETNFQLY